MGTNDSSEMNLPVWKVWSELITLSPKYAGADNPYYKRLKINKTFSVILELSTFVLLMIVYFMIDDQMNSWLITNIGLGIESFTKFQRGFLFIGKILLIYLTFGSCFMLSMYYIYRWLKGDTPHTA